MSGAPGYQPTRSGAQTAITPAVSRALNALTHRSSESRIAASTRFDSAAALGAPGGWSEAPPPPSAGLLAAARRDRSRRTSGRVRGWAVAAVTGDFSLMSGALLAIDSPLRRARDARSQTKV